MEHSADGMKGCMHRDIWGVSAASELIRKSSEILQIARGPVFEETAGGDFGRSQGPSLTVGHL